MLCSAGSRDARPSPEREGQPWAPPVPWGSGTAVPSHGVIDGSPGVNTEPLKAVVQMETLDLYLK